MHCLLLLARPDAKPASSRDLAELQGISTTFLAKIFPKLERAGLVKATAGIRGGYQLARLPEQISVLDVVDAIEGAKPLFDCQQIRGKCTIFEGNPPPWMTRGICGIHAVMLKAEKAMRDELARTSIRDLVDGVANKAPPDFGVKLDSWFSNRIGVRTEAQIAAVTGPKSRRKTSG
ncbi:Rrf2 family protein [Rhodoferax ferrireducens]|uniref:Rrf2 family protein n=1 Tax=Rhodoferax ferrireducens TaxID=192843 RepID=A0ABU2C272_9BURK|nr:Rrf2 family protein [Rhodoferax ferrireducens]